MQFYMKRNNSKSFRSWRMKFLSSQARSQKFGAALEKVVYSRFWKIIKLFQALKYLKKNEMTALAAERD